MSSSTLRELAPAPLTAPKAPLVVSQSAIGTDILRRTTAKRAALNKSLPHPFPSPEDVPGPLGSTSFLPTPKSPPKVPRPCNAFILYRSKEQERWKKSSLSKTFVVPQSVFCAWVGQKWKSESAAVKQKYYEMADEAKALHMAKHPDYKYQPAARRGQKASQTPRRRSTKTLKGNRTKATPEELVSTPSSTSDAFGPKAVGDNILELQNLASAPKTNRANTSSSTAEPLAGLAPSGLQNRAFAQSTSVVEVASTTPYPPHRPSSLVHRSIPTRNRPSRHPAGPYQLPSGYISIPDAYALGTGHSVDSSEASLPHSNSASQARFLSNFASQTFEQGYGHAPVPQPTMPATHLRAFAPSMASQRLEPSPFASNVRNSGRNTHLPYQTTIINAPQHNQPIMHQSALQILHGAGHPNQPSSSPQFTGISQAASFHHQAPVNRPLAPVPPPQVEHQLAHPAQCYPTPTSSSSVSGSTPAADVLPESIPAPMGTINPMDLHRPANSHSYVSSEVPLLESSMPPKGPEILSGSNWPSSYEQASFVGFNEVDPTYGSMSAPTLSWSNYNQDILSEWANYQQATSYPLVTTGDSSSVYTYPFGLNAQTEYGNGLGNDGGVQLTSNMGSIGWATYNTDLSQTAIVPQQPQLTMESHSQMYQPLHGQSEVGPLYLQARQV